MAATVVPVETAHEAVATAATEAELQTHEQLDAAAHEQIAQTEDEDYKWLTDRLDALQAELNQLRSLYTERVANLSQLLSESREQSSQLISAQTEMIRTLMESVTKLSESALLTSTLNNSPNESEQTPATETTTVTEVQPQQTRSESTQEETEQRARGKKFRRI